MDMKKLANILIVSILCEFHDHIHFKVFNVLKIVS